MISIQDKFYIITNWKAKNNRLMQTPDSKTDIANWEEVLPHREKAHLLSLEILISFLCLLRIILFLDDLWLAITI